MGITPDPLFCRCSRLLAFVPATIDRATQARNTHRRIWLRTRAGCDFYGHKRGLGTCRLTPG